MDEIKSEFNEPDSEQKIISTRPDKIGKIKEAITTNDFAKADELIEEGLSKGKIELPELTKALAVLSNPTVEKEQQAFASAMFNKFNPGNDSNQKNIDYRFKTAFLKDDDDSAKDNKHRAPEKTSWAENDDLIIKAQNNLPFHPSQDFRRWMEESSNQ